MQPRKKERYSWESGGATVDTSVVMRYRDLWSGLDLFCPARNPIGSYVGQNTDNSCLVGAEIKKKITRPDYEIRARFMSGHSPKVNNSILCEISHFL